MEEDEEEDRDPFDDDEEEAGSDAASAIEEEDEDEGGSAEEDEEEEEEEEEKKTIPPGLLTRMLYEFFENKPEGSKGGTKITQDANAAVAKYVDVFVREAIARAAVESSSGRAGGFLEVSCPDARLVKWESDGWMCANRGVVG